MSRWISGGGSSGGTGGRQFYQSGSASGSSKREVYKPPPSSSGGTGVGYEPEVGVANVNLLDPSGQKVAGDLGEGLNGLKLALFGSDVGSDGLAVGSQGKHGGFLGDVPLLGDIGRGVGGILGGATKLAGDALEDAHILERIGDGDDLDDDFKALPSEFLDEAVEPHYLKELGGRAGTPGEIPAGMTWRQLVEREEKSGLLGGEFGSMSAHFQSTALRAYDDAQQFENPELRKPWESPSVSLMGVLKQTMDWFDATSQVTERATAEGIDRIAQIRAVSEGKTQWRMADGRLDPENTVIEQLALEKVDNREWTEEEALDFLTRHGAGYSHDPAINIAGEVLLDPINVLSFGAAFAAKAGTKGLQLAAASAKAQSMLEAADTALDAARAAREGARGKKAITAADKALDEATAARTSAADDLAATKTYAAVKTPGRQNLFAKGMEGRKAPQDFLLAAGKAYSGVQGTTLGKAMKATRFLIDPLHAIDLRLPGNKKLVDLVADTVDKTMVDTMNPVEHMRLLDDLDAIDGTGAMREQFARDFSVGAKNRARELIMTAYVRAQVNADGGKGLMQDTLEGRRVTPDDLINDVVAGTEERDLLRLLREDTVKNVLIRDWSEKAIMDLSRQMESIYHGMPAGEWAKVLGKMSKERLSFLKHAVYGHSNRMLLDALEVAAVSGKGAVEIGGRSINDLVLLARTTFTRVRADRLLSELDKAKSMQDKVELIRVAQDQYPSLRFITVESSNQGRDVGEFVKWLDGRLDRLPMEVKRSELATLDPGLQELRSVLGDGYTLGFAPADEFKFGIERVNVEGGKWGVVDTPFVSHVADTTQGYRPARHLDLNIVGVPILGQAIKTSVKAVDYMAAGSRILKAQVSGATIAEMARKNFISEKSRARFVEHGLTEGVAQKWWTTIQEFTQAHKGYTGPRGFAPDSLYNELFRRELVPEPMLNGAVGQISPNDIMRMVMEAYDGDLRFLGLTQKFTSKAKSYIFRQFGTNFAGQIADHLYPTLRFHRNPIFQLQEKIEPIVWGFTRGYDVAGQVNLTAADKATERWLQKLTHHSIIRQADLDQGEFSPANLMGGELERWANRTGTQLGRLTKGAAAIMDVQGTKRINLLRTFRQGLGKELRTAWEAAYPGKWDDMLAEQSVLARRPLDEDEFALLMIGENLDAWDGLITKHLDAAGKRAGTVDPGKVLKPGTWQTPTNLGELRPLDLDNIAAAINIPGADGKPIQTVADLRRYLAEDHTRIGKVTEFMNRRGFDADQVVRVENALTFSWEGFWRTAGTRFGLSRQENMAFQDMVAGAAELRGMDPVDFLSQVFSPQIIDGQEGILGELAKARDLRSKLAGKAGESTRDDLVRQMSAVFSAYLDPSAKRRLLMEFKPELRKAVADGKVSFDPETLKDLWGLDMESALADRILGYVDGKLGTHAFDELTDATRGVKAARDGAAQYLASRGVTPHTGRRHYVLDNDAETFYQKTADEYSAMAETPYERTGRVPTSKQVYGADLDLKPKPAGMDDRTYEAYRDFVVDNDAQWEFMTKPKNKGGMGIKVVVSRTDPYPNSAAMRDDVAKGRIRVMGRDSDHPLMTNEQNLRFRAIHDVFGHAAEGFEFGPRGELNAAAKHAPMYSDTGRAALLSETHAQTSYNNFSNDVIKADAVPMPVLRDADPVAHYEELFPFESQVSAVPDDPDFPRDISPRDVAFRGPASTGGTADSMLVIGDRIGDAFRALPPAQQKALLQPLAEFQTMFPDVQVWHIDTPENFYGYVDQGGLGLGQTTDAATFGSNIGEPVIMFSPNSVGARPLDAPEGFAAGWDEYWAKRQQTENALRAQNDLLADVGMPTPVDKGIPANVAITPESVLAHEYGHAVWGKVVSGGYKEAEALIDEWKAGMSIRFEGGLPKVTKNTLNRRTSTYARTDNHEAAAELFAIAFPEQSKLDVTKFPGDVVEFAGRYRQALEDGGLLKPLVDNPLAGKTVRDANKAAPGSYYGPQRVGILSQGVLDEFSERFVGRGKHVESSPDVARTAQMFAKWSERVIENGLMKDGALSGGARSVLDDLRGVPTDSAVPYDLTEGLLQQRVAQAAMEKFSDANKLTYFAAERSFLERSVNHPMFGLYPASYMWGKVMPEMIRFIAQKPFGIRTGGLAYTMMDVQAAVALEREFNPEFDAMIEKIGASQALSALSYLLPGVPWDLSASMPIWAKNFARQGLANQQQIDAGQLPDDINVTDPLVQTIKKLNPMETTLPWMERGFGELLGGIFNPPEPGEEGYEESDVAEPVRAAELGTPLARAMQELQEALAK